MFVDLEVREFNGFSVRCNINVKKKKNWAQIKLDENEISEINSLKSSAGPVGSRSKNQESLFYL